MFSINSLLFYLQIKRFKGKGRGIVATRPFLKGEFITEYQVNTPLVCHYLIAVNKRISCIDSIRFALLFVFKYYNYKRQENITFEHL